MAEDSLISVELIYPRARMGGNAMPFLKRSSAFMAQNAQKDIETILQKCRQRMIRTAPRMAASRRMTAKGHPALIECLAAEYMQHMPTYGVEGILMFDFRTPIQKSAHDWLKHGIRGHSINAPNVRFNPAGTHYTGGLSVGYAGGVRDWQSEPQIVLPSVNNRGRRPEWQWVEMALSEAIGETETEFYHKYAIRVVELMEGTLPV